MPGQPKGPPPGERPPQPQPQEHVAAPPEKKKVDAAFWDKFKEFQKLPPEERVPRLQSLTIEYDLESAVWDPEITRKLSIFRELLVHPERCRAAIAWEQWPFERNIAYTHNSQHTKSFLKNRAYAEERHGAIDRILHNAINGKLPSNEELTEDVEYELTQGTVQTMVRGTLGFLRDLKILRNEIEELQWLGSMDDEKMKEVLWGFHDEWENNEYESAQAKLAEEIKKWREEQGKRE